MRTIIGKKGLIALSVIIVALAAGVWAWQAGYLPEIGKFFAAEPGISAPSTLTALEPDRGPVGTHVVIKGENLPADGSRVTVRFGSGIIQGVSAGWYVEFDVPSEIPTYCPPGAYCALYMIPVQPGAYDVSVQKEELCTTPTPEEGRVVGDASYECGRAQSNSITFTVTEPSASCVPLPECYYANSGAQCAFEPAPGVDYCPIPTVTPYVSCTPLPPCVYEEGPGRCAVRPAPGTIYCPTPTPIRTCLPRPACLDARPSCEIAEPADGWCSPTTVQPVIHQVTTFRSRINPGVWAATIEGTLPNSCYSFDPSTVQLKSDHYIDVTLTASAPRDLVCTQAIAKFKKTFDLDAGPVMQAGTYRLTINGGSDTTFTVPPSTTGGGGARLTPQLIGCDGVGCRVTVTVEPQGYEVTAVSAHLMVQGGTFTDTFRTIENFPQFLSNGITNQGGNAFFEVGIKPEGPKVTQNSEAGSVGVVFDRATMRPGDPICVTVDLLQSSVAAVGVAGSVLSKNYSGNQVCIPIPPVSARPGDLDLDGDVDIFDYNIVVTNFGRTTGGGVPLEGDADHDRDVDIFDYNIVVTNFGR